MDDVERAVEIALDSGADPNLKLQATSFCEEAKTSIEGWNACLGLFTAYPYRSPNSRFFALQVLEQVIRQRTVNLSIGDIVDAKGKLLFYLLETGKRTAQRGSNENEEPAYIRNKFAQVLSILIITLYEETWPSAFRDIFSATKSNPVESLEFNLFALDAYLRTMQSLNTEIADQSMSRDASELQRNMNMKDLIRKRDAENISSQWFQIAGGLDNKVSSMVSFTLDVVSNWIRWFDINSVANDRFMMFIYSKLSDEQMCVAACETLASILSKKMAAANKLSLITTIDINNVVNQVSGSSDDFAESLAKLANVQGVELIRILEDKKTPPDVSASCEQPLLQIISHALRFLQNETDDVSVCVFPFIRDYLALIRKQYSSRTLDATTNDVVRCFQDAVLMKMKYDPEAYEESLGEDEEAEFLEFRNQLKVFEESIATINLDFVSNSIQKLATELTSGQASSRDAWPHIELLLYQMLNFGDRFGVKRTREANNPLMDEAITAILQTESEGYQVPIVRFALMEVCVKQGKLCERHAELAPRILEKFLDANSAHSPDPKIRARSWYLFARFCRACTNILAPYTQEILNSISDLLEVTLDDLPNVEPLDELEDTIPDLGQFQSRLFLFEASGIIMTSDKVPQDEQVSMAKSALDSLLFRIMELLNKENDAENPVTTIVLHRYLCALSSFARGITETSFTRNEPQWLSDFSKSVDVVLQVLQRDRSYLCIRTISRQYISRIISISSRPLLEPASQLIQILVPNVGSTEIVELISFVVQLAHRYQKNCLNIINKDLQAILQLVFPIMIGPSQDSESERVKLSICKSYFTFLSALVSNDLNEVFTTQENISSLDNIVQSIVHYMHDMSEPSLQRSAIQTITKIISAWGSSPDGLPNGFEPLIFNVLSEACFEIPLQSQFNLDDAQSQLVLSDLAMLQKTILSVSEKRYADHLLNNQLPKCQLDASAANDYINTLACSDIMAFRPIFKQFIQNLRASRGIS